VQRLRSCIEFAANVQFRGGDDLLPTGTQCLMNWPSCGTTAMSFDRPLELLVKAAYALAFLLASNHA
jgi:hypothetical protein